MQHQSLCVNDPTGRFVATIVHVEKVAESYRPDEPWLLRYKTGRVEHFDSLASAKQEAVKTWGRKCSFEKSAT